MPVVFGGLHATVLPEEVAGHADAVVVGEGELLWPEVVSDFRRGGRAGLKRIYREARPGEYYLREAPLPRFDLLQRAGAAPDAARPRPHGGVAPPGAVQPRDDPNLARLPVGLRFLRRLQTLRAALPPQAGRARAATRWTPFGAVRGGRSSNSPTTTPSSTSPGPRPCCARLANRDVRYFTETDVSLADDEELLDLLYPSGCRQVLIGFESPRRESLRGLDTRDWKAGRVHKYLDAIEKIQARGVSVCGCFIVGLDADTPAVFDGLQEFIERFAPP